MASPLPSGPSPLSCAVKDVDKVGCHGTLPLIHKQALLPTVLEDLVLRTVLWEAVSQC